MGAKKRKFYVVWTGHTPGIYNSWEECKAQVDNYKGARYKSFMDKGLAEEAFQGKYWDYVEKKKPRANQIKANLESIISNSISVDAACSGNPGVMEYRGVETGSGKELFLRKYPLGTNNIGEFLAIVHGLAFLKKRRSEMPIYSDSRIAMNWVRKGKCLTKLEKNSITEYLFEKVAAAEEWLKEHTWSNQLIKWETKDWGEIPADFGRK